MGENAISRDRAASATIGGFKDSCTISSAISTFPVNRLSKRTIVKYQDW